jgi:hypothetical protein
MEWVPFDLRYLLTAYCYSRYLVELELRIPQPSVIQSIADFAKADGGAPRMYPVYSTRSDRGAASIGE